MNIADVTRGVKKELSGDERVLESAFKLETYYKKYKFLIWAIIVGLIVFFVGRAVMQSIHEDKLVEANKAFLTLQTKADDKEALSILKEKNPTLYELFSFSQASKNHDSKVLEVLSSSDNAVISDSSAYAFATLDRKSSDSKLYREMALLQEAYLYIRAGDIKNAKAKLELIEERSSLFMLASLLKHSTLKAK